MKKKLSRVFLCVMIVIMLLPLTAFGQAARPTSLPLQLPQSDPWDGPPPGFDPGNLKLSDHQPTVIGEVSAGRDGLAAYIIILDDPAVPSY
jgi:hypothetical protein